MAKATWFNPAMDLDLFHLLVEDAYTPAVPSHPDLVADKFGRNFVISARHFDVTVAMDVAPGFLEARKERVGQRLQVGAFLFKTGSDLLARRTVDPLVSDISFPTLQKGVLFGQRAEAPALQCVVANVSNCPFYLAFVLWFPRATGHNMQAVMATEVS